MPTVDFARTLIVPADEGVVWSTVTDVTTVAGWVSVVAEVVEVEPLSVYRAELSDGMGPFTLRADLLVKVIEVNPPERIGFSAEGEDLQIGTRIRVGAVLALRGLNESTEIDVRGSYEVTGRVATLGASMIRTKGEKILDEFCGAVAAAFG